jgi:hypothetical protein
MRKSELIVKTVMILLIVCIFVTCDSLFPSGNLHEKYLFEEDYWGEWIRMDTGDTWYFAGNYMLINNYNNSIDNNKTTTERQSQNVIKVTEGTGTNKKEYYLYASRLRNSTFGASAVTDGASMSVFARVVNVPKGTTALVNALKNGVDKQTIEIGDNGELEAENIIAGDDYKVTIDDYDFIVTPNTDGDNVGTLTLTQGVNMKTSIVPQSSWSSTVDLMRLYSGKSYDLTIKFTNVSDVVSSAMAYKLIMPEGLTITKNNDSPSRLTEGDLQSFKPNQTRDVDITVQCGAIAKEFELKEIVIKTEDFYKKTWNDSVSLKVNKESVTFNIKSNLAINGVVIVPNGKAYHFKTSGYSGNYSAEVTVPKYKKDYLIVFSGALDTNNEAKYSFAVNKIPASNFNDYGVNTLNKYWPNGTEKEAKEVSPDQEVMAYLMMNTANYYKVRF